MARKSPTVYYWPIWTGSFLTDHRPSIVLRGQWQNPDLAADDQGSLSRAFNADGTVNRVHNPNQPYPGDITQVTLVPGSYPEFETACKAH